MLSDDHIPAGEIIRGLTSTYLVTMKSVHSKEY